MTIVKKNLGTDDSFIQKWRDRKASIKEEKSRKIAEKHKAEPAAQEKIEKANPPQAPSTAPVQSQVQNAQRDK